MGNCSIALRACSIGMPAAFLVVTVVSPFGLCSIAPLELAKISEIRGFKIGAVAEDSKKISVN